MDCDEGLMRWHAGCAWRGVGGETVQCEGTCGLSCKKQQASQGGGAACLAAVGVLKAQGTVWGGCCRCWLLGPLA